MPYLPRTVWIHHDYVEQCKKFSVDVFSTNKAHYARRRQTNEEKIRHQTVVGKMAEYGAWMCLKAIFNDQMEEPDTKIYPASKKTFNADLNYKDLRFHVKACEVGSKYPQSWIFQWGGNGGEVIKGHRDKLFRTESPNDLIVFCAVSVKDSCVQVFGVAPAKDCLVLLKDPVLDWLKGIKKAIYKEDLIISDVLMQLESLPQYLLQHQSQPPS